MAWVAWHYERVMRKCAALDRRLLVFDIDRQGSEDLSRFLGRPVTWPHANATRK